jgi:hypothetical protein
MSKFLVERSSGKIRSTHEHPLEFSVSGKYVIDVPTELQVRVDTDVVADLVNEKIERFQALNPGLPNYLYDELLTTPNTDTSISLSGRSFYGKDKRTAMPPNAFVWTNATAVSGIMTQVFPHWYGFSLFSDPDVMGPDGPRPSPLLYNYNPVSSQFEEFLPAKFKVDLYEDLSGGAGPLVLKATLDPDTVQAVAAMTGTTIRLRFENLDPDRIWYLSDWLLLYD